mmetsp:Transcript_134555/g.287898  ORF Transcript_134555/g.287898 Transcript_134555/m.287898 type:complete len:363 (-) Transcript_134555:185-1273(-)
MAGVAVERGNAQGTPPSRRCFQRGRHVTACKSRGKAIQAKSPTESPTAFQPHGPGIEERFHKTKICSFWERGCCLRGNACTYAHGDPELINPPDLRKTKLCRELMSTGECSRMADCPFAHNRYELRGTEGIYRTSMCRYFSNGQCRLGALCRHAHSVDELRSRTSKMMGPGVGLDSGSSNHDGSTADGPYKTDDEDSGDDMADLPQWSTWERTATMPPSLTRDNSHLQAPCAVGPRWKDDSQATDLQRQARAWKNRKQETKTYWNRSAHPGVATTPTEPVGNMIMSPAYGNVGSVVVAMVPMPMGAAPDYFNVTPMAPVMTAESKGQHEPLGFGSWPMAFHNGPSGLPLRRLREDQGCYKEE